MKTYMKCRSTLMNIALKLTESDDTFQITMGNEIFDAMEDLNDVVESQCEEIQTTHFISEGVKFDDVKCGEYIDMEAGLFLRLNHDRTWTQIDGGYGLEVSETEVKKWLGEKIMSEVFEDRDSFHYWFMISALAGMEINDDIKKYPRSITMQINGVEINPEQALERLDVEIDKQIESKAQSLMENITGDLLQPFEDSITNLQNEFDEKVQSFQYELNTLIKLKIKEMS